MPKIQKVLFLILFSVQVFAETSFPPKVSDKKLKACQLTASDSVVPNIKVNIPNVFPQGKLFMGGGGWAANYDNDLLNDIKYQGKKVVINLSAAKDEQAAARSCLGWQIKLGIPKADITCLFIRPDHANTLEVELAPSTEKKSFFETRYRMENGARVDDINGPNAELITTTTPVADSKAVTQTVTLIGNLETAAKSVTPETTHFIIGGGFPWMLDESVNSNSASLAFWGKIRERYQEGAYVYGSSAGTDMVGPLNTGKLLAHEKAPAANEDEVWEQHRWPSSYYQEPHLAPGAGISPVSFLSHGADDPRLIVKRFFAGTYKKEETFLEGGGKKEHETFLASNPEAFLEGIQNVIWKGGLKEPMIVVPQEAYSIMEGSRVKLYSPHPSHRFFIYDPRHPPTKDCEVWYVVPGDTYNIKTGLVEISPNTTRAAPLVTH